MQSHARNEGSAATEENTKPEWLDRYVLFLVAVFTVACGIILQLVTGYPTIKKLDKHLAILGSVILFFVFSSGVGLWFLYFQFSEKNDELSKSDKILFLTITVLNGIAIMAANVVLLDIIYRSYIGLAAIPVIGFILLIGIFSLELKLGQNQRTPINPKEVKNNLKIAIATTAVGCSVQGLLITQGYLKNPNFPDPKDHPQFNLILPCLTSALGCFVMIITSAPLLFKSDLMNGFLKQISKFMAISVWLVAANLSAEFLGRIGIVVVGIIPIGLEMLVMVCREFWKQQATQGSPSPDRIEVDPIHATVVAFAFGVLSTLYSQNFGRGGYSLYLTYSVFFIYLSITTISIRMVFPAHPRSQNISIIESVIYSLPMVLALGSLAWLLAEICRFIRRKIGAVGNRRRRRRRPHHH